jgi:hypothetical protein
MKRDGGRNGEFPPGNSAGARPREDAEDGRSPGERIETATAEANLDQPA